MDFGQKGCLYFLYTNSEYVNQYGVLFTDYYNTLINTFTTSNDHANTRRVIEHFIADIFPAMQQAGYDTDAADNIEPIASNSLVEAINVHDETLQSLVLNSLLGENFELNQVSNATLLYNLACYYAAHQQKQMMLKSIRRAIKKGKSPGNFLKDDDFKYYLEDSEFISVLAEKATDGS